MIESYLLGMVTGFVLGVAVIIIPEKLKMYKDNYVELRRRDR